MSKIHKAANVAEQKKNIVKKIADLIRKYPIIGSINLENLPAAQLQKMKAQLRDKVEMFMTKRRLMKLAIEQVKDEKKGIEKIEEHLKGMPILLFTNENPFSLCKALKKSKTKAPAKAGQTAPSDIVVKAGPTPFVPGPVISELGALGIKTKVEEGKINIIEDAVVCREGEEISLPLAGMLARLGIEPMEIGLDLVAVYEKGDIFTKSVLDIDEEQFMADLTQAARWAFNLSCGAAFVTEANREVLLQKAFMDAKALALSESILADAVVEELLSKAEMEMLSVKSQLPETPAEAPKAEEKPAEAPKEEVKPKTPKAEEKKEEPKPEEKAPEPPKEEPKAEEKKEEPKAEEKAPEPKAEEKPKQIPEKVEEPKQEVAKPEEKKEEAPKAEEKVAEEKKPEPKKEEPKSAEEKRIDVDKKVENIVEQAKMKAEGKQIAEALVEEVAKEESKEKKEKSKEEPKPEEKAPEPKKEYPKEDVDVAKVEKLAQTLMKKGTLQDIPPEEEAKKEEKVEKPAEAPKEEKKEKKEEKSEVEEVEELTKKLLKKGTLRK